MPFDVAASAPAETATARRNRRLVALWLFGMCAMVLVMIMLGGATRLTGSGLSIMEWAPLSGTLPPLSEVEWNRLFALYQHTPQYQLVNQGFGLAGFKHIFWLEWTHRLWGRAMGVVFLLPLIWFAATGVIGRAMVPRLALLFVLGGLQGAVGWFMVASGFEADNVSVEPVRLVAHLTMALALYAAMLWIALSQWRGAGGARPVNAVRRMVRASALLVALTIVTGGFVAGLHAGLTYNTFPLMDGRVVPEGYASLVPFWRNLIENIAAVQFDHRLLATATLVIVTITVLVGLARTAPGHTRVALAVVGAAVTGQYLLGIATLLSVVRVEVAVLHQTCAALLLTAILVALHHLGRSASPRSLSPVSWSETPAMSGYRSRLGDMRAAR